MSIPSDKTQSLVDKVAISMARQRRDYAIQMVRDALMTARNETEPLLAQLMDEIALLRKALAGEYCLSEEEFRNWDEHCAQISACGGNPPDFENWKVELALDTYRYATN